MGLEDTSIILKFDGGIFLSVRPLPFCLTNGIHSIIQVFTFFNFFKFSFNHSRVVKERVWEH